MGAVNGGGECLHQTSARRHCATNPVRHRRQPRYAGAAWRYGQVPQCAEAVLRYYEYYIMKTDLKSILVFLQHDLASSVVVAESYWMLGKLQLYCKR